MTRLFDPQMLGSIELFCLAAEQESFSRAAMAAGVTPAAVSRAMSRLEERLGVRLFVRSTRRVRPTDAGRLYLEQCRQALGQLSEAGRAIGSEQHTPRGTVRLSVPTPIGHCLILPLLARFRTMYPLVHVDVHLSNRNVDLANEGFDLAIRGRAQPDSGLVARQLFDAPLVTVASPAYLKCAGTPQSLSDLAHHDCIQFVLPRTGQTVPWLFRADGRDVDIATAGGFTCSEDLLATATLCRHGGGLLQTYRYIVVDDLERGGLCEVLQAFAGRSRPLSLLYPNARQVPHRVRLLIDFLVEHAGELSAPARADAPLRDRPARLRADPGSA